MTRIGICAGTFDPVHYGHLYLFRKAAELFDKLYIFVADNKEKKTIFKLETRFDLLKFACEELAENLVQKIEIRQLQSGLLIKQAEALGAQFLVRGVRDSIDCAYELNISNVNYTQIPEITTIFIPTPPELSYVSSSAVRELLIYQGDLREYLPTRLIERIFGGSVDGFTRS